MSGLGGLWKTARFITDQVPFWKQVLCSSQRCTTHATKEINDDEMENPIVEMQLGFRDGLGNKGLLHSEYSYYFEPNLGFQYETGYEKTLQSDTENITGKIT